MAEQRRVPRGTSDQLVATLARIARSIEEREVAGRRRTMAVVEGGKRRRRDVMTVWIRRRPRSGLETLTMLWHIEGKPNAQIQSQRGFCGESIASDVDVFPLEAVDGPDLGDRCPSCQGAHARGDA